MTFEFHPIPATVLAEVRSKPAQPWVASGGEPLRCCLRGAVAEEELILFNYEPPLPMESPYREKGAVFAHTTECDGPAATDRYPSDWLGKPQVLRAYDSRGWIHPSTTVHDGQDPEGEIAKQLADPDVAWVHSRNIAYGCYMFTVTRAAGR